MTSRQLRRAAERKASKQNRAEINRANAGQSTGPRTPEGKTASSQNSFKHGLYSKALVMDGENPAELDALKTDLRREHQPANTTEEILVNEMAEQHWRIRRFRKYEAKLMSCEDANTGMVAMLKFMPIAQRAMAAAERGFHKALTALRQLQKERGFVPQTPETTQNKEQTEAVGFVPQTPAKYSAAAEAQWAEAVAHGDVSPDDTELRDRMAADADYFAAGGTIPHARSRA